MKNNSIWKDAPHHMATGKCKLKKNEIPLQFSSVSQSCPTLCDPMDYNMPGFHVHYNSQSLLKLMSIDSLCHPTISSFVIPFFSWLHCLATWSLVPLPFLNPACSVHVLLKPGLENFEHYFASVWDEYNYMVVWAFFGIASLWDLNEIWPIPVLWTLLSFPNWLIYWVQHFHNIIF